METECGKVIADNRKRLGWTQAELGAKLNVTAQAVSKWETGNAEPDFSTLQRLSELFGIGPEEFFGKKKTPPAERQEKESAESAKPDEPAAVAESVTAAAVAAVAKSAAVAEPAAVAVPQTPSIIIGYCDACKKPIEQTQKYHVYSATRGRAQRIVCYPCYKREEASRNLYEYNTERKTFRRSIIVASLVAALVVLIGVIAAISAGDPSYLLSIATAAALFMFVAQCFWTSYTLDLLLFFCRSFRLPGVIFTLDLDGILWFISVKLLFGILTCLLSVLLFGFGLLVSMAVGIVTFPFCLTSEIKKLRELKQATL